MAGSVAQLMAAKYRERRLAFTVWHYRFVIRRLFTWRLQALPALSYRDSSEPVMEAVAGWRIGSSDAVDLLANCDICGSV